MTGPGRPRVVIVDDHGLFRSGVRSELGDQVEVVGEAEDVGPAIALIARVLPDVVLLDVHLPGGGGQAVVSAIRPAHPHVRFLALSASDAPEDVIAVIRAGARGYVTKTISGPELVDAVCRIAAGDTVFSPRLAGFVLDAFAALNTDPTVMENFQKVLTREESAEFIDRNEAEFEECGWGLWAVEVKDGAPFIGFVGLHRVPYRVTSTTDVLHPLAAATGGDARRIAEGNDLNIPRVVPVRTSTTYKGDDWIGLKMRDVSVVRGIGVLPVFAGLIGLLLLVGSLALTWAREGR